jgi:hypothetical protein
LCYEGLNSFPSEQKEGGSTHAGLWAEWEGEKKGPGGGYCVQKVTVSLWKWKDKQAKSIDEKQEGNSRSLRGNPHTCKKTVSLNTGKKERRKEKEKEKEKGERRRCQRNLRFSTYRKEW